MKGVKHYSRKQVRFRKANIMVGRRESSLFSSVKNVCRQGLFAENSFSAACRPRTPWAERASEN